MKPVLPAWAAFKLYWFKISAAVVVPVLVYFGASQQTVQDLSHRSTSSFLTWCPLPVRSWFPYRDLPPAERVPAPRIDQPQRPHSYKKLAPRIAPGGCLCPSRGGREETTTSAHSTPIGLAG